MRTIKRGALEGVVDRKSAAAEEAFNKELEQNAVEILDNLTLPENLILSDEQRNLYTKAIMASLSRVYKILKKTSKPVGIESIEVTLPFENITNKTLEDESIEGLYEDFDQSPKKIEAYKNLITGLAEITIAETEAA